MEFLSVPVRPVRTPAPYIGGKRNLSARLCSIIEAIPHRTYAEPFVGMGGVFLKRRARPPVEVINDVSGDVVTLYRVLREHYPYFMDYLRWRVTSRAEFDRLLRVPPDTMTDIQRATRFLYLQRLAFGGKVNGRNFGVDRRTPGRFDVTKLEPMLADLAERLAGVVIEQLPFGEFIRRYDGEETLFYLDPPYWGCTDDYGKDVFAPADFERLAVQLAGIHGHFVLSINDAPELRRLFAQFQIEEVPTTYTIATASAGAGKSVDELVIRSS
jgi:DNA adenine methylase